MHPTLKLEPEAPATPRVRANRANALHSTGPRSSDGKLRSAQNALTHGLTSRAPVIPGEDREAYRTHCEQFRAEYRPQTPTEAELVQDLADTAWRLHRVPRLEAELLRRHDCIKDCHQALATLSAHGQRLSRQFHKTLSQLRAIQAERRKNESRETLAAAAPDKSPKTQAAPRVTPAIPLSDLPENGFVFSAADIQALHFAAPHLAEATAAATAGSI